MVDAPLQSDDFEAVPTATHAELAAKSDPLIPDHGSDSDMLIDLDDHSPEPPRINNTGRGSIGVRSGSGYVSDASIAHSISQRPRTYDLLSDDFVPQLSKRERFMEVAALRVDEPDDTIVPEDANESPSVCLSSSLHRFRENADTADGRRFTVFCRGRWRLRAAPHMRSMVVGTVASGSTVIAVPVAARSPAPVSSDGAAVGSDQEPKESCPAGGSGPWLRVLRFEVDMPTAVNMRSPGNSSVFCYRRNKKGHGLYEVGVESTDDLRNLLGEVPAESSGSEETSTTFKLLEAVEVISRALNPSVWQWQLSSGCSSIDKSSKERPPDKVFEKRQRAQLHSRARALRDQLSALVVALQAPKSTSCSRHAGLSASTSLNLALPGTLPRRFHKLDSLVRDAEEGRRLHMQSAWTDQDQKASDQASPMTIEEAMHIVNRLEACRRVDTYLQKDIISACGAIEPELETQRQRKRQEHSPLAFPSIVQA